MIGTLDLPTALETTTRNLTLRRAHHGDLLPLLELLADDPVSTSRGDEAFPKDATHYAQVLAGLLQDPSNELLVLVNPAGELMATMQLTRIPGLTRRGATRLQIEAVRVSSNHRSSGIGSAMMRWVLESAAPAIGASLVQLTSDAARTSAHRFYEQLGFRGSHRGFKYQLAANVGTP